MLHGSLRNVKQVHILSATIASCPSPSGPSQDPKRSAVYVCVLCGSGARRALQAVFPIRKEGQLDGRRESLRSKCRGFRFDPPIAQQAGDLQDSDAQIFPRRTLAAVGSTQYTRTHKVQDCPGLPANTTNPDYLSSKLVRQPHMAPPGVATPKRLGAWRFTPSSWKRGRGKSREHTTLGC